MLYTFKRRTGIDADVDILTRQQILMEDLPLVA
jgi:hypothetical protein